jgi:hypothetical protein
MPPLVEAAGGYAVYLPPALTARDLYLDGNVEALVIGVSQHFGHPVDHRPF